jgi:hypothetical protein
MPRLAPLAVLALLAGCAPPAPQGTPIPQAELQSALPGHVSDFGNGVLITWQADGRFLYEDRLDASGALDKRVGVAWGPGGTYAVEDGRVCMTFPNLTRCDGMFRTASGALVATIGGWPYAVTLR